jgi:SpoVK/Ycf46/Vps4 family AAA+-type ATPase
MCFLPQIIGLGQGFSWLAAEDEPGRDRSRVAEIGQLAQSLQAMPFRGILIIGVPGTGKSHFCKALGNEVNWPVLSLDMGKVFGSLVGESEQKMRETLKVIDAMAPCILFIDEIEKALSGVGGQSTDGGTSQRVGGTFLQWMQDHTSEVFCVAT